MALPAQRNSVKIASLALSKPAADAMMNLNGKISADHAAALRNEAHVQNARLSISGRLALFGLGGLAWNRLAGFRTCLPRFLS